MSNRSPAVDDDDNNNTNKMPRDKILYLTAFDVGMLVGILDLYKVRLDEPSRMISPINKILAQLFDIWNGVGEGSSGPNTNWTK